MWIRAWNSTLKLTHISSLHGNTSQIASSLLHHHNQWPLLRRLYLTKTTNPSLPRKDPPAELMESFDHTSHGEEDGTSVPSLEHTPSNPPARPLSPIVKSNRLVQDEPAVVTKVNFIAQDRNTSGVVEEGHNDVVGGGGRKSRPASSMQKRTIKDSIVKRSMLGVRVCGFVFCLISFSVMAGYKKQGWAHDSFDRYIEFMSVSFFVSSLFEVFHHFVLFRVFLICKGAKEEQKKREFLNQCV